MSNMNNELTLITCKQKFESIPVFALTFILMLSGCVMTSVLDTSVVDSDVLPVNAIAGYQRLHGRTVQWGGLVVEVTNNKDETHLEILSYPLRSDGDPDEYKSPTGRFLVKYPEFLEPLDYAPGRYITVVGTIESLAAEKIGESIRKLPVLKGDQIHLWPKSRYRHQPASRVGFGFRIGL